jgi:peroxin-7
VLCLDWNKYRPMTIATGSTDRVIKTWDLRNAVSKPPGAMASPLDVATPLAAILGHEYAVRKVAYSPHAPQLLASASYDMTARIWDADAAALSGPPSVVQPPPQPGQGPNAAAAGAMRKIHDTHTEFVVGVAWSLFQDGLVASTAWDSETHLWGVH